MIEIFDTHTHYDDEKFNEDRHKLLAQMQKKGVVGIINAGTDLKTSLMSIELSKQYEIIYAACGVHPHEAEEIKLGDLDEIKKLILEYDKAVAVGEIGLDYYYDFADRNKQKEIFDAQLSLAEEIDYPVIIHDRDAHKDVLDILSMHENIRGVFHCYQGSVEMSKILIDKGFYLAFGGSVTFKNSKRNVEVVRQMPIERLLVETDCPYLTPVPYRGRRNDSSYVTHIIKKIAEIKNKSVEEISAITIKNAKDLFLQS